MRCFNPFPGGHSGVVPPDPIPNSEVKRACADGSVALPCKSRSPPGALSKKASPSGEAFVFIAFESGPVASAVRGLQQVTARGFIPKTSTRNGGGFFFWAIWIVAATMYALSCTVELPRYRSLSMICDPL